MNGKGYIYLITNNVNRKGYVGQTTRTVATRWRNHKSKCNSGVPLALYSAMRKYGIENFSIRQIVCCDELLLDDLEKHYIKYFGTRTHGYNRAEGGSLAPWNRGLKTGPRPAEVGQAISAGRKGIKFSDEHKANLSKAHKGLPSNHKGKTQVAWNTGLKGDPRCIKSTAIARAARNIHPVKAA